MKLRAAAATLFALTVATILQSSDRSPVGKPRGNPAIDRLTIARIYGRLPLDFEANRGQTDGSVKFVSRGQGYTLFLTPAEAVLALRKPADRKSSMHLRMKLAGANPSPKIAGRDVTSGESNYILGRDRRRWRSHVPRYAKVEYEDVYPGVSLIYYGNQQQLEFDFVVSPGANPERIALTFEGAQRVRVEDDGSARLETGAGEIELRRPRIYQDVEGTRQEIRGAYVLKGERTLAFEVAAYDRARPLVVDPVLVYSTYLGGTVADVASGIAVDQDGSAYVVGHTLSLDFPTTPSVQPACAAYTDESGVYCDEAFVTKLSADGTSMVYSTYLGGTYDDIGNAIAVDSTGSAYITGSTRSLDFPTVNAFQPENRNDAVYYSDAFVAKLSPDGATLVYSSYLGGGQHDVGSAIAIDPDGSAHVTGWTSSPNFPTASPIQSWLNGPTDAYIAKLTPDGSALVYSTFFGNQWTDTGNAIVVGAQGDVSIAGETIYPIGGGSMADEAFVLKLRSGGSQGISYTSLGPGVAYGIAMDGDNTYITGVTRGLQPVAALQPVPGGDLDAFVVKLDSFARIVYATYLGGSGVDIGSSIAVDAHGNCIVAGMTASADFPTVNPLQGAGGEQDVFVAKINPQGTSLLFSTYLGGSGSEQDPNITGERQGPALAVSHDESGASMYLAGYTVSPDFPTAAPLQAQKAGYVSAFVAKIFDDPNDRTDLAIIGGGPVEADLGTYLFYRFRITNYGPAAASGVTLTDQLPSGVNFDGAILFDGGTRPEACTGDGGVLSCQLGALAAGQTMIVDLAVTPTVPGMLVNTASVTSTKTDSEPANNSWVVNTIVRDLSLTYVGGAPPEVPVGEDFGYMFTVANNGPAIVTNVLLTDQLPDGVLVKEAIVVEPFSPPRPCLHDNRVVQCLVGAMAPGGTFTVAIIVNATTPGTLVNTATVRSDQRDGNPANNTVETRTVVTRSVADLSVTVAASPNPVQLGGIVTYTFDVMNLGPSAASNVVLTDGLGQESFVSASASIGSCTGGSVVTCTLGSVPSGSFVRVTIQTTAIRIPDMARTYENIAVATTSASDPQTANNTARVLMNVNTPPIANAGPDQIVSAGGNCRATVMLNGTASSDPEGDPLTYTWTTEDLLPPPILLSNGSGGALTGPTPTGSVPAGTFTILLTVSDGRGGTATDTVRITVRDTTAPVFSNVPGPVVAEQTSPAGASVSLGSPTATDNCSGSVPASSNAPAIFPPGTTTVIFSAADAAGNSATASTTVTVRDTIAPAIQILSPQASDYAHTDPLVVSFSVVEAGSGLSSGSPESWLDGVPVANGQSVELLTLALGEHGFTVSAMDVGGNPAVRIVTFRVVATIDSLTAAVNVFAAQGQIDDSRMVRSLLSKLEDAKDAIARGSNKAAINKLNELIDQVNAQVGQHITASAAQLLVTDARYVIATLQ